MNETGKPVIVVKNHKWVNVHLGLVDRAQIEALKINEPYVPGQDFEIFVFLRSGATHLVWSGSEEDLQAAFDHARDVYLHRAESAVDKALGGLTNEQFEAHGAQWKEQHRP